MVETVQHGGRSANRDSDPLRRGIEGEHRSPDGGKRTTGLWISVCALVASIAIAVIGAASGQDLERVLGEWRFGVVVLLGAALLFSYTLWLHLALNARSKAKELEQLHVSNARLADEIHNHLERRTSRSTVN
jgi:hypothetical protein